MNGDLISREALRKEIRLQKSYAGTIQQRDYGIGFVVSLSILEGKLADLPTVDAVPQDEYEALLRRFRHLMKSDFIASFDKHDRKTHTYKRDIAEADNVQIVRHGKWLGTRGDYVCSICGSEAPEDGGYWDSPYCPMCGAKMDEGG